MGTWILVSDEPQLNQISVGSNAYICGCDGINAYWFTGGTDPYGLWTMISESLDEKVQQACIGSDGSIWALVGEDGKVFKYNKEDQTWTFKNATGSRISVGSCTMVCVINSSSKLIYQYTGDTSNWEQLGGSTPQFQDVGIGSDGTIWAVGTDELVYMYDNDSWKTNESWENMGKGASRISVGSQNMVCVLDTASNIIYQLTDDGNSWVSVGNPSTFPQYQDVGIGLDGAIWGTDSDNNTYYYLNDNYLQISDGELQGDLGSTDSAIYEFQILNTSTSLTLSNIQLTLCYDQDSFTSEGITIGFTQKAYIMLGPNETATVKFNITTNGTPVGGYGIYGVTATYAVTNSNAGIICDAGGWLNFNVSKD